MNFSYKNVRMGVLLLSLATTSYVAFAQSIKVDNTKYDSTIQTFLSESTQSNDKTKISEFIVATVGKDVITNQELRKRYLLVEKQIQAQSLSSQEKRALLKQVFDELVLEKLQILAVQDTGYYADTKAVDAAVATVAQQNKLSPAELLVAVQKDGIAINDFRQRLLIQIYQQKAKERFIEPKARVTDFDIETRLAQYQSLLGSKSLALARKQEINIAQLLIAVPETASPEQQKEALEIAQQIQKKAQAGANFANLQKEYQLKSSEADAKGMGYRDPDQYPSLFTDAVQNLKIGGVSELVQSGAGWHVLQLLDKRSQVSNLIWVPETRARHILLRSSEGSNQQALIQQLNKVRQQIQMNKQSFETVASSLSQDASAANGGDLGWAGPGQFVPEFESVMNQLTIGEISPPVVSRFGVHLIQVVDRRANQVEKLPVRERIRAVLREENIDKVQKEWFKEIKDRAYIELKEPPHF